MSPHIPILAQSENKSKFLERLGISDQTEDGKRLYAMMKEEAIAGRARMSANPHSLLPRLINDPTVKPPYSNTQISEAAMHRETLYIYQTARPETRAIYDRGHYMEGGTEENWIIKWLLWHVFRYRDNRNRGRALPTWIDRPPPTTEFPMNIPGDNVMFPGMQLVPGSTSVGYSPPSTLSPIDQTPLHPSATQPNSASPVTPERMLSTGVQQQASQGYWDPVRDAQRTNR
ncbi:hypothetical protein K461DRAFT_13321 [Myriangium duriaei CBS 260.36]|uniref:Uncharacterized protein n=1 Tax=Myriangium duriaei CBS 260.36 TaxID=1168546 RepID=A0A9P4MPH6_9PEZI|nr:hypothetical protein K461DRAFT_13321 [Myriangium duriaei CBS 260.36]